VRIKGNRALDQLPGHSGLISFIECVVTNYDWALPQNRHQAEKADA
jgi:hypothetical protein